MKNTFFYVGVLFVLFSVVSCNNDDERIRKEIIGSFSYSNPKGTDGYSISFDGIETFDEDGVVKDESILSVSISKEEIGDIRLKYRITFSGRYQIFGSHILYDYSDIENNSRMELLSSESSSGSEAFALEIQNQMEEALFPDLKRMTASEENAAEIYELNEEQLVVLNPEGQKIIKKRIVEEDSDD